MCQCCVLSEHNLWCAVIVCVCSVIRVCGVCAVWTMCVWSICGVCVCWVCGVKECVECVECVCVFGVHVCFRLAHDGSFTQAKARSSDPNLIMENSAQEQGT